MHKSIITIFLLFIGFFSGLAGEVDSEGYPKFFLRGEFNGWGYNASTRFAREGNVYTLTMSELNGQFKIANTDWTFNYGGEEPDFTVSESVVINTKRDGYNLKADNLSQITISFTFEEGNYQSVNFTTKEYPIFYLRGDELNGWGYNSTTQFTRSGDTYSLTLETLNGEFKISNKDWSLNYGGQSNNVDINGDTDLVCVKDGYNIKATNLSKVTLKFDFKSEEKISLTVKTGTPTTALDFASGTLPILYINVRNDNGSFNNEIIDKDLSHKNYFTGEYWLDMNGCQWLADLGGENLGSKDAPLPLEIKARGNWTRIGYSKKPFKIKLGKKQSMLGMSKSKHYTLLAHADDNKGYLRNFVGFNLGQRIGLPWTPSQQPVELIINGDYRGLYFLTESIRVEADRVDIAELGDNATDPELISGGYIVELDNYDEPYESQICLTEKGVITNYMDKLRITFDTPEIYSDIQRRFITDQFNAMNDAIGRNSDDLWTYMDLDDAVRYYIVEEIITHTEAYHGSTYLFRDRGEGKKWHWSPIWDCGHAFDGPTDGYFYENSLFGATWIPTLRINDKFNEKLAATWKWFISRKFYGIYDDIDQYVEHISAAATADRRRWKDQPTPWGGAGVCDNSNMTKRRNTVVDFIKAKVEWLAHRFGSYTGNFAEPARDTTPAAPLPEYATTAIENVTIDSSGTLAPAEYFNLQGLPVAHPITGTLYILRRGTTTTKVVY